MRRTRSLLLILALLLVGFFATENKAQAQDYNINNYFYYPYYYFPHSYWPIQSPPYPERVGEPYQKPPAYMAHPAFHEPHWRYHLHKPMSHYRGFHFWLDQF
jgi:hypothetical protein